MPRCAPLRRAFFAVAVQAALLVWAADAAQAGRPRRPDDGLGVYNGVAGDVTYAALADLDAFRGIPASVPEYWFSRDAAGQLAEGDDTNLASGCPEATPCASQSLAKSLLEAGPAHVRLDPGDVWSDFGDISSLACAPGAPCQFISGSRNGERARIVCSFPNPSTQQYVFGWYANVTPGARAYVQGFDTTDPSCKAWDHYSAQNGMRLVVLDAAAVSEQGSSAGNYGHSFVTKTGAELVVIRSSAVQRDDGGTRCSQPAAFTSDTRVTLIHVDLEGQDDDCSDFNGHPDRERLLRLQVTDAAYVGGTLRWTGTGGGTARAMVAIHNADQPASLVMARVRAEGLPDGDPESGLPRPRLVWAESPGPWAVALYEVTGIEVGAGFFIDPGAPSSLLVRGLVLDRRRGSTWADAPILHVTTAGNEANLTVDVSGSYWDEDDDAGGLASFRFGTTSYGPVTNPDTGCPEAAAHLLGAGAGVVSLFDACDPSREIGGVGVDGRADLSATVGGATCVNGRCTGPGAWIGAYSVPLPAAVDEVVLGEGNAFSAFLLIGQGSGAPLD